jgi:hypothetical protein
VKIQSLRKKNIINFSLTIFLLAVFIAIILFVNFQNNNLRQDIDRTKNQTSQIRNQGVEIESKTIEIKKYKELWKTIEDNKKNITGIKVDDVNKTLDSLGEKYSITKPVIKITLPEALNDGIFFRQTINVLFSKITLSFNALDDAKAIMFLSELTSSLPGYLVVNNFEIKKGKNYSSQDLIDISVGKISGTIEAKADILWYSFKEKETKPEASKTTQK